MYYFDTVGCINNPVNCVHCETSSEKWILAVCAPAGLPGTAYEQDTLKE